jgi:hypothetical protein
MDTRGPVGLAFVVVIFLLLGPLHFAAGRDPYRNFVTQLIHTWYDAHSPYEGEGLRRMLRFMGVGYVLMGLLFAGLLLARVF